MAWGSSVAAPPVGQRSRRPCSNPVIPHRKDWCNLTQPLPDARAYKDYTNCANPDCNPDARFLAFFFPEVAIQVRARTAKPTIRSNPGPLCPPCARCQQAHSVSFLTAMHAALGFTTGASGGFCLTHQPGMASGWTRRYSHHRCASVRSALAAGSSGLCTNSRRQRESETAR